MPMLASHDVYIERNERNLDGHVHGALEPLIAGAALSNVAPINITVGIGKLVIVAIAGGDPAGVITVTGDTVDRDTGVVTPGNVENITLVGLSTDTSDIDAEGNDRHGLAGAYITSNWFSEAVQITTAGGGAGVTLTDTDVYQCSFEQMNDVGGTLETFDINVRCLNVAGWFYAYLYTVSVSGSIAAVTRVSSLSVPNAISAADRYYRLRDGSLSVPLVGTTDGIFINLFFGPAPQLYWADFSMKLWMTHPNPQLDLATLEIQQLQAAAAACTSGVGCTAQQRVNAMGTAGTGGV